MSHTISARANVDLIDQKYSDWREDPNSVDQSWAMFFEGFELGMTQPALRSSGSGGGGVSEVGGGLDLATRARRRLARQQLSHSRAHRPRGSIPLMRPVPISRS